VLYGARRRAALGRRAAAHVTTPQLAILLALAGFLAVLALAGGWRLRRRHLRELADRDASYKALLEINVRHYRDIAERDARYRILLEQAGEGVVAESEGRIIFANPAAMKIFGWQRDEDWAGESFLDLVAEESREDLRKILSSVPAGGPPVRHEMTGVRSDGSAFELEITPARMMFHGKTAVQAILRDVTERRRAEEALRESEQKYRDIFDFASLGIYQSRRDGSLLTANRPLAEMLGYDSPEELMGRKLDEIYFVPGEREELVSRYEPEGKATRQEVRWKRKDGTTIWIELDARTVRNPDGTTRHFEGFVHDISERKETEAEKRRLQEQLVQAQKMEAVGQLAGGIAHDFNNLLTAITGYSELLLGELPPEDLRRSHAEEIRKAGERAASLTQQLLAFSRRQVLAPRVLDVNTLVSDIERMLRRLIGEHIELKTRKMADLWRVRADPGQIEQAILNLVLNARDAMPQGGVLTIETSNADLDEDFSRSHVPTQPGPYVRVAVTDTGVGISDEIKARLFEPFFTTKEMGKGTGLGLSTTYGIVKQSGGYLWCESGVGRGTTFTVFLPRVAEPLAEIVERKVLPPLHPGNETVLLVEDEPEVRSLVQRILKTQGYTVVTAANPDEALAISREFKGRIELMVTDVVMPGMSGLQLAERLLPTRPDMRVLFVSGYTDDAMGPLGILEPGKAFLQKPFTPAALARKVREVLDARTTEHPPHPHLKNP
jgi:PAS domain S-box-containing protein